MEDMHFRNELSLAQVADTVDLLRKPRLLIATDRDYPGHPAWLDVTEAKLSSGDKRAMTAFSGMTAIGAVIYQRDPLQAQSLEIKNISVSTDTRGEGIARHLLRTTEVQALKNDFPGIKEFVADTKIHNAEMIAFLESQGYDIKEITDLYGLGAGLDVVMSKPVDALGPR